MTPRELESCMQSTGQERALRKLCIDAGLAEVSDVAVMSTLDVCERVSVAYELVGVCNDGDRVLLVAKNDEDALWKLLKAIDR